MTKRKILRSIAAAAICCCTLATAAAADCIGGASTTTEVNLRSGAGTDNSIIFTASTGTPMIVESKAADGWYRVYVNGTWGYMSADYLSIADTMDVAASGWVNGTGVRMRSAAGTDSQILRVTSYGESVEVTGVAGNWYRVNAGGMTGYIRSDYVELGERTGSAASTGTTAGSGEIGQKVVDFAKQYMGYSYVWAGSSPSTGFDCSGFVSYVYKSLGYQTNRTAADIYKNGVSVAYEDLQPGDAVLFASSSEAIGHVGIYIGDGQFIHASSGAGYVTINSLSESYYARMYVGARRIAV